MGNIGCTKTASQSLKHSLRQQPRRNSKIHTGLHAAREQIELANQGMLRTKQRALDIGSDGMDDEFSSLENSYPEVTDPGINSPIFYIAEGEKSIFGRRDDRF